MPEQPSHRLPEEFGGNEWLVDELYERYQQDKNTVDAKWWPLFESFDSGNGPSSNGLPAGTAPAANPATRELPVVTPPAPAQAPASATPAAQAPAATPAPAPAAAPAQPAPAKKAPVPVGPDGSAR